MAQKYRGHFGSIFREQFRASKKIFRANFVLQTCRPKKEWYMQAAQRSACKEANEIWREVFRKLKAACFATPLAWYKCQNSQNAQKCSRESAKSDLVPLGRESQNSLLLRSNPVSHRAKHPKAQFRTMQGLSSHSGGPKTPFALSLSTFGHFGCFDTCTRPVGSQCLLERKRNVQQTTSKMGLSCPASFPYALRARAPRLLQKAWSCKNYAQSENFCKYRN